MKYSVELINNTPEAKPSIVKYEDRILKLREEAESCNTRKKNLYEDFKDGVLSREEYSMLKEQYQNQLAGIEGSIASIEAERDGVLANGSGKQEWIEKLKKYDGVKELDRELITFLIEKILVINADTIQVNYRFEKALKDMEHMVEIYSDGLKEAM